MVRRDELRELLFRGWIRAPGTTLRREDEKKCLELEGFLAEVSRAFDGRKLQRATRGNTAPLAVVDAAAGKGYVGLLLSKLPDARASLNVRVTLVERDPKRVEQIEAARAALELDEGAIDARCADVGSEVAWPRAPHLVASLHACGEATDRVIREACRAEARVIVIAPCCVAARLPAAKRASERARRLGLGDLGEARRRFIEAEVLAVRALALEAEGYRVETVPFAAPTVTPYNVALRALRGSGSERIARAKRALLALE